MLRYGDVVLVYIDEKRKFIIKLRDDGILGTDKGFIKHSTIIGRNYGDEIYTSQGVRAFILKPLTPDYLAGLRRTTQVIYPKDAALMIHLAGVKPCQRIIVAGVGTGYLTLALASHLEKCGEIYGYDIDADKLSIARLNLELAGLKEHVRLIHGDIRSNVPYRNVDGFFLDIPDPWNALATAFRSLAPSSPLVVYVPTVNQMEKTVSEMRRTNCFLLHEPFEAALIPYNVEEGAVRPKTLISWHTGYIIIARKVVSEKCAYL
jgi:tRNA (adenine57-N1/adenine58-N1)-methyltransferase